MRIPVCVSYVYYSCRYCNYPQELVLRLSSMAHIRKIQLLSHHYMICKYMYMCTCTCVHVHVHTHVVIIHVYFIVVSCE